MVKFARLLQVKGGSMLNDKEGTPAPREEWTPQQERDYQMIQVMRLVGAKPDVIHGANGASGGTVLVEVKQDDE